MCDTVTRVFPTKPCCRDIISKTCGKYTEKSQNMPSFSPFKNVWENLQKGSTRRRPFVLSVKKMWENAQKRSKICCRFVLSKTCGKMKRNVLKYVVALSVAKQLGKCTEMSQNMQSFCFVKNVRAIAQKTSKTCHRFLDFFSLLNSFQVDFDGYLHLISNISKIVIFQKKKKLRRFYIQFYMP